jgi:hypothetical protein
MREATQPLDLGVPSGQPLGHPPFCR